MGAVGAEDLMQWEKIQEGGGGMEERILVSVRLRPMNAKEIARNDPSDWECINDTAIIFRNSVPERSLYPTAYTFDRVFRSDTTTKQVYEEGAKEVALSVVSGINSSIFAYGQTSSGKTYTMAGITECTVADIYDYIERHEERAFVLKFSAIEIYNEAVRDLLCSDSTPLRLLDDPERGTVVEKLTEETLRDWSHLKELLSVCEAQRQIGETSLNETSSRSHQILRLTIESSAREFLGKDKSSTLAASVNFVDLAGSERASQALSAGARLKEGCHINRSLLTLGTVIRKLSKGRNGHIPYRDSKLTRILQPSLGGNARTAIICTMSPARSHVEQSRNTLLFASCAKEVVTSAQVNVVMSDKALVKHLQRELARLESELRYPGTASSISPGDRLLKEKDTQIQKMEKEIKELTRQRDLAQSRLEDLLQVVGEDQTSRQWERFKQPLTSHVSNAFEDEIWTSESSGAAYNSQDFAKFSASLESGHTSDLSDEHYPQASGKPNEFDDISSQRSIFSSSVIGYLPHQGGEDIALDNREDPEDICKEVRCIEMDETCTSRNEQSNHLSTNGSDTFIPLSIKVNEHGDQELVPELKGEKDYCVEVTSKTLEQRLQDVKKAINNFDRPFPSYSSPWPLSRSRSCKATLMSSSTYRWFPEGEQNENTPPSRFLKDFPGRPEGFQRRLLALNFGAEIEASSGEGSQTSEHRTSIDVLKTQNTMTAAEEDTSSIRNFVTGLKEMAQIQYQKQLTEGQEAEQKANECVGVEKDVKDVGVDPMLNFMDSPSNWPQVFEKQQGEIIELWHECNASLVHRTCFFLLFKGDHADSIYMEVELRRLSFLKRTFAQEKLDKPTVGDSSNVTLTSSMRSLRREREMLCRQMQKRLTAEERESLYRKWGIAVDSKQRRLQLARLLWSETKDMDHIRESASIVATLIGLLEPGQVLKEMFGLSFTPQRINRRSYSWKHGMSSLL